MLYPRCSLLLSQHSSTYTSLPTFGFRELRPLINLLLPLSVHWVAEEMTVSVLVDVTTSALCPGEKTCSKAIYINRIQQTVVGIFKMVALPLLGQLVDEWGRKPLLLITNSTTIIPFGMMLVTALLVWHQSAEFVYAYYVIRRISYIISQRSIFCISVAYVVVVVIDSRRAAVISWITGLFSLSRVLGNVLARFLPENYIFLSHMEGHGPFMLLLGVGNVWHKQHIATAFGFKKNQFAELLMMVGIGSIFSRVAQKGWRESHTLLCLACINSLWISLWIGIGILGALLEGLFRCHLFKPSGKGQGFIAGVQCIHDLLSPLAVSPLRTLFLSSKAAFDFKGFSIICASTCMIISLRFACLLEPDSCSSRDVEGDPKIPFLTDSRLY